MSAMLRSCPYRSSITSCSFGARCPMASAMLMRSKLSGVWVSGMFSRSISNRGSSETAFR